MPATYSFKRQLSTLAAAPMPVDFGYRFPNGFGRGEGQRY